jgi:iron complex outermembrane receptor protein
MDFGLRKNFFNKMFTLAVSCRDLLNSRQWETFTSSDTFTRHQINRRGGRRVNFTLTWNFGNTKAKKKPRQDENQQGDVDPSQQYSGGEE